MGWCDDDLDRVRADRHRLTLGTSQGRRPASRMPDPGFEFRNNDREGR